LLSKTNPHFWPFWTNWLLLPFILSSFLSFFFLSFFSFIFFRPHHLNVQQSSSGPALSPSQKVDLPRELASLVSLIRLHSSQFEQPSEAVADVTDPHISQLPFLINSSTFHFPSFQKETFERVQKILETLQIYQESHEAALETQLLSFQKKRASKNEGRD